MAKIFPLDISKKKKKKLLEGSEKELNARLLIPACLRLASFAGPVKLYSIFVVLNKSTASEETLCTKCTLLLLTGAVTAN